MTGYYLIHINTKTEEEQVEMRDTLTTMIIEAEEQGTINSSRIGVWSTFGSHARNKVFISGVLDQIGSYESMGYAKTQTFQKK